MKNEFTQVDFGPIQEYLDNDDVTDISYSNGGQVWLKTLSKGVYRVENPAVNNAFMEKMAFQCANSMGKSFNMANPFLDSESAELRMNFVHESIARNGIAVLIRKTPAKIRLEKDKIIKEDYIRLDIHDFLLKCVEGHCNILVSGETGSGKTEFVKYMAAHTKFNEKLITIEDTLELHLDRIFPERDIVAMKTNNIASYADVLVTCMRQNPRWILLSEVRSAEAVMAVRDSISSGHNILSTIHADKAESIPSRLYSLLESSIDMDQFLRSIHRYVQLGVHIKGYYSPELQRFKREVAEVVEFYVDEKNNPGYQIIYKRPPDGSVTLHNPTKYLLSYLESQGVEMPADILVKEEFYEVSDKEGDNSTDNEFSSGSNESASNYVNSNSNVSYSTNPNVSSNYNSNVYGNANNGQYSNIMNNDQVVNSYNQALQNNLANNNLNTNYIQQYVQYQQALARQQQMQYQQMQGIQYQNTDVSSPQYNNLSNGVNANYVQNSLVNLDKILYNESNGSQDGVR